MLLRCVRTNRLAGVRGLLAQTQSRNASAVVFEKPGDPQSVLKFIQYEPAAPKSGEVLVRMLAAPIHPLDLDIISGANSKALSLLPKDRHHFAGLEGVGEVVQVGPAVSDFAVGDRVVPRASGLGTWRTHLTCATTALAKVPRTVAVESPIMMPGAIHTALGLLTAHINLEPGSVVVQNAAASSIGQLVIQFAAQNSVRTINIVSARPEDDEVRERLKDLGGDVAVTVEYVNSELMDKVMTDEPAPLIGFDGIGGDEGAAVAVVLGQARPLVQYGRALSRPSKLPSEFKPFKFDLQEFLAGPTNAQARLDYAASLIQQGQLNAYLERHPLDQATFLDSVLRSRERFIGRKLFFSL